MIDAFTPNIPTEGWDLFRGFVILGALAFYSAIAIAVLSIGLWLINRGERQ